MIVVLLIIGLLIVFGVILLYNGLIKLRERVRQSFSDIDVQLKKRFDLVPNLVETVKGYAKHEKELFENVTKARSSWQNAKTVGQKARANNMLSETLKSLFAVAENYPNLKANENFRALQEELSAIETKIAYARQFYNEMVAKYNMKIKSFPEVLIAGPMGFKEEDYFQIEETERENVKVKF